LGDKHRCVVCGKAFPEGQGIMLKVGDEVLAFHNKRCAVKFFKALIEEVDVNELKRAVSEVKKMFEEDLRKAMDERGKKI